MPRHVRDHSIFIFGFNILHCFQIKLINIISLSCNVSLSYSKITACIKCIKRRGNPIPFFLPKIRCEKSTKTTKNRLSPCNNYGCFLVIWIVSSQIINWYYRHGLSGIINAVNNFIVFTRIINLEYLPLR